MNDFPTVPDASIEDDANTDVLVIAPRKRRRDVDIVVPPTDGQLTINVNIIGISKDTMAFSQKKRCITISIKQAGRHLSRVDIDDARNNVELPKINASVLHSLVINYFGEEAQDILDQIKAGRVPKNSSKSRILQIQNTM